MIKKWVFGTSGDANAGVLILRVFIGAALMTHGVPKLFGGLEGFTGYVEALGIPAPALMAFLAAFTESIGAFLLLIGLLTRPAALMMAVAMAVAALVAHGGEGFAAQEKAWLFFFPAVLFLLKGGGKWSVDYLITRRHKR